LAREHSSNRKFGEWLSLVEHLVRDQGVGGSNPLSPTIKSSCVSFVYDELDKLGITKNNISVEKAIRVTLAHAELEAVFRSCSPLQSGLHLCQHTICNHRRQSGQVKVS